MQTTIRRVLIDLAGWYMEGVKIRELSARGGHALQDISLQQSGTRATAATARATVRPDYDDGQRATA